jgi:hypothetical protein
MTSIASTGAVNTMSAAKPDVVVTPPSIGPTAARKMSVRI